MIAFDRQERGKDENDPRPAAQVFSERHGIPVLAAATLDDLVAVLEDGHFPDGGTILLAEETLPKIMEYRFQYGCAVD